MNSFVLTFAIFVRVSFVRSHCIDYEAILSPIGPTFIDQLRIDYLKLERDLWNDIKFHLYENTTRNDDNSMIDQIRNHHLQFLSQNFHDYAIELNLFEREDEIIFDAINKINYSVDIARLKYLKDFTDLQDELKMILIAQDHLDLTPEMNYLFEFIATYGEYFQYVSCECELCARNFRGHLRMNDKRRVSQAHKNYVNKSVCCLLWRLKLFIFNSFLESRIEAMRLKYVADKISESIDFRILL